MYHFIYITNLPSFYKITLLNRINEQKKILVIFTNYDTIPRNKDFFNAEMKFDYHLLKKTQIMGRALETVGFIKRHPHNHLIVGGWDQLPFWVSIFTSPKKKNGLVLESSILESKLDGIKGLLKKFFLSRIICSFVPGQSQKELLTMLGFKGKIIKTKGVGIFNIQKQPHYKELTTISKFLYVGRLSPEKNLEHLIQSFNNLPHLRLQIIGFGPQEEYLKSIAGDNIEFLGAIANKNLHQYYRKNHVFLLPSISEPWGLVVEEALNNGFPVIVSNKVGCASEIVENNGLVFDISDPNAMSEAIRKIQEPGFYNQLRYNISQLDFDKVADQQVHAYIRW